MILDNKAWFLLGLSMYSGYRHDQVKDADVNEYNSLNSGAWDISGIRESLIPDILSSAAPELDSLIGVEEALESWWAAG